MFTLRRYTSSDQEAQEVGRDTYQQLEVILYEKQLV